MKNIYQDNSFQSNNGDIYSSPPADASAVQKPVRPVKHAPPPIKKSAPQQGAPQPQIPPQPYYGAPMQGGQPMYPTYPMYYVPVNGEQYPPQPPYGQAPIPAQYNPYMQPVAYPQSAPAQAPAGDTPSYEAGTRVLYQSSDFDRKEAFTETEDFIQYETLPKGYSSSGIEMSEVSLPNRKRAGTLSPSTPPPAFKVDEMEIGAYELGAMAAKKTSKATGISSPKEEKESVFEIEEFESEFEQEAEEDSPAEEEKPKKKKLAKTEIIRRTVLIISLVAIVISAAVLLNEYRKKKENERLQNDMSNLIISDTTTTEPASSKPAKPNKTTTTAPTTKALTPAEQWQIIKDENPNIIFPQGMQLKYAKLYARNTDLVGYLYADGSDLDTPVVQAADDEEYVEKNFYGERTQYGCPFVTHVNNLEPFDTNTVIFGHNMRDGSIFGTLRQYETLEGYKKAPIITFNTLYNDYKWKIVAVFLTNINEKDDNGYVFRYYWTSLSTQDRYSAYLNEIAQRSFYDTGVDVLPTDKLLTLSTCSRLFTDGRLVVVARLVRPGEVAEVDTSLAVENPNPRYPQAYYDEHKMENPYANAYRWEVG